MILKRPRIHIFCWTILLCLTTNILNGQEETNTESSTSSKSFCGLGCIRCNPVINACEICDQASGFVLDSQKKSCEKSSDANCILYDLEDTCIKCKIEFYYRIQNKTCIEVPTEEKIENCAYYDSATKCIECSNGYYLSNGSCQDNKKLIENCAEPKDGDLTLCSKCLPGKLLSTDGTECMDPPDTGCSSYKNVQCLKCKSGYLLNPNQYMTSVNNYLVDNKGKVILETLLKAIVTKDISSLSSQVCTKPSIDNCYKYKNSDECEICNPDYFVTETKKCEKNPADQIQFCEKYQSNVQCTLCKDNYFFYANAPSKCEKGKEVENCDLYHVNQEGCQKCSSEYYLDNELCVKRVKSLVMPACLVLDPEKDACKTCNTTFALTLEGCVAGIPSCAEYQADAPNKESLVCTKCDDGTYFNADKNECEQPATFETDFCQEYKFNAPVCNKCKKNYYFDDDIKACKLHDNVDPNCADPSLTTRNSCGECKQAYKSYPVQKLCKPVTNPDANCIEYETAGKCKECKSGYFGDTCQAIPAEQNCQKVFAADSSKCETCNTGYYTNTTPHANICQSPFDAQKHLCEKLALLPNKQAISCSQCAENTYPLRYDTEEYSICELKTHLGDKLPANCLRATYNSSEKKYVCTLCEEGKVLEADGCHNACSSSKIIYKLKLAKLDINKHITIEKQEFCDSPVITNCKYMVPRTDVDIDSVEKICADCKDGFHKIIDMKTAARVKAHSYNKDKSEFSMRATYPEFTCKQLTVPDLAGTTSLDNCEYFVGITVATQPKFACFRCIFGKTGKIVKVSGEDIWVIESCNVDIDKCVVGTNDFKGLTKQSEYTADNNLRPLVVYTSCLECSGGDSVIPFINVVPGPDPKMFNYQRYKEEGSFLTKKVTDLDTLGGETEENFNGETVKCRDYKNPTTFGLPDESTDFNAKITFIENCALGAYQVDQETTADAIYCIACQKGYTPTFSGLKVTACTKIDKCAGSETFNDCLNCEGPYDETNSVCYQNSFADPNCLRIKNNFCIVCKDSYTLNEDGLCEQISAFQCEDGHFELPGGFLSTDMEFVSTKASRLGETDKNFGCTKCKNNYIALKSMNVSNICVESTYMQQSSLSESTNFIVDCLKYGYDFTSNSRLCMVCKSGKMPDGDFKKCLPLQSGCLYGKKGTDSQCGECDLDKTLINGVCVTNSIANCLSFYTSGGELLCQECEPGYYIKGSKECLLGAVDNCKIFKNDTPSECVQCLDKYVIFKNVEGQTFCLSYATFNCLEWSSTSSFACDKCVSGFYPSDAANTDPSHFCVGGNYKIDNCKTLNPLMQCIECNADYYLNSVKTRCLLRSKKVENCKSYDLSADECSTCNDKFYLDASGECYPYPVGIQFCLEYSARGKCARCDPKKYLSNNLCLEVTKFVENCSLYKSDGKCSECENGFFLVDASTCTKITAVNCLEHASPTACSKCNPGDGLATNSEKVTSCVATNLGNCDENTLNEPYECIKCSSGFYIHEKKCIPASPKIDSCKFYIDNSHCKQCDENFVLSLDKRKCMSNYVLSTQIDFNCLVYEEKLFQCSTCGTGKQFIEKESTVDIRPTTSIVDPLAPKENAPDRILSQIVDLVEMSNLLSNSKSRLLQDTETSEGENSENAQPATPQIVENVASYYSPTEFTCETCGGEGCSICDPKDATKCVLCLPTYYMKDDYKCYTDQKTTEEPTDNAHVGLLKNYLLMAVIMLWVNFGC